MAKDIATSAFGVCQPLEHNRGTTVPKPSANCRDIREKYKKLSNKQQRAQKRPCSAVHLKSPFPLHTAALMRVGWVTRIAMFKTALSYTQLVSVPNVVTEGTAKTFSG